MLRHRQHGMIVLHHFLAPESSTKAMSVENLKAWIWDDADVDRSGFRDGQSVTNEWPSFSSRGHCPAEVFPCLLTVW